MAGLMQRGKPGAKEIATLKGAKRNKDGVKESPEKVTAPVAFSSKPGKAANLIYATPEEQELLRRLGQGHSEHGSGEQVAPGKRQHMGPRGLMSFNGEAGNAGGAGDSDGDGVSDGNETPGGTQSSADYGGEDQAPESGKSTADEVAAAAAGVNGFAGSGFGFGGFGAIPGAVTAAGEMVGEIARDAGMSVSTPTAASEDDPSTDRNEANDPSAFGGGSQGNGLGGVEGDPSGTTAAALINKGTGAKQAAQVLQAQGRDGDTVLAHISEEEAAELRARGGRGTINPKTGLPEFAREDNFDEAFYLQQRPDVKAAMEDGSWTGSAWDHYKSHGQMENTVANEKEQTIRDTTDYKGPFGFGGYAAYEQGKQSAANDAGKLSVSAVGSPDLPSTTPATVPQQDSSVASNLDKVLSEDGPIMKRAAAQGLMVANRRGLMNSTQAIEASQNAVLDRALPIASQDAAQGHQSNMQRYEIDHQKWLANLDANLRGEIATMQENTKREIANLQVGEADRGRIASLVADAQRVYAQEYATIVNNPDIPAEARDTYFQHIQNMLSNSIRLIEGMYGVNLDWNAAA